MGVGVGFLMYVWIGRNVVVCFWVGVGDIGILGVCDG